MYKNKYDMPFCGLKIKLFSTGKKSPRLSFDNFERAEPAENLSVQGSIQRLAEATK